MSTTEPATRSGGLKRELRIQDAAAFSIGLIGPVGAMAVNGVGAAGLLSNGVTRAFIFALLGVLLVAYGFVKLFPYFVAGFLALSAVVASVVPGLAGRVRITLADEVGIADGDKANTSMPPDSPLLATAQEV